MPHFCAFLYFGVKFTVIRRGRYEKIIALIVGVLMLLTGCSPEDEPRVIEHKCQEYQGDHEIKHLVLSESLNENQSPEYYYALYSYDLHTSFQPPSEMEFEFNGQKIHARYYYSNHPSYAYYSVYYYSGDNGERIVIDERGTIVEFWTKNIEPTTDICIGEDKAVDKAKEILGTLVDIEGYSVSVKTRESSSSYNIRFQKNVSGIDTFRRNIFFANLIISGQGFGKQGLQSRRSRKGDYKLC